MKYTKPALSVDDQVKLLQSRGMLGDSASMKRRLSAVNYYRLSGYWAFRRIQGSDRFETPTHFDSIWERYVFDRELRLLVMDAIERVEVGVRTQFSYHHTLTHGPFGYENDPAALPQLKPFQRNDTLRKVTEEVDRSREEFIDHFRRTYGDEHALPPLWMATEVLSFGCVLKLWEASPRGVKEQVAACFAVRHEVLTSWLWALNEARNICAHHGRLWNRSLGRRPLIPFEKKHPEWHRPVPISAGRVFAVLTICAHSLTRLAPRSQWQVRVRRLLEKYPKTPLRNMGFPDDWLDSPIWALAAKSPPTK